jgi:plastocyanin domain-containing protein
VRSDYEPAIIHAAAGAPITLRFRRESIAAWGERVIFPALGKSIQLPLFGEVTLELMLEPGRYEFTCEQGFLRGVLEVGEPRRSRAPQSAAHERPRTRSTTSTAAPLDSRPAA